jgi:subtilisin family serine protease
VNGLGIAGVAPKVNLVNLRAGQDSGYFFLQPTLDALTYAADSGVDVVNMSFYVDPWLYNCQANPADSPEEQLQQRVIVTAVQRAIDYARSKGVLPVSASGNEATDLGAPGVDSTSPDYPVDADGNPTEARDRTIDNATCLNVPAENDGVVTVNSTGPSGRKAYYSNFGTEQSDVSAPGGDAYDTANGRVSPAGEILAAYPEALAIANGDVDENGEPTSPFVVREVTRDGKNAYYQYLQGTSMASPHAAGVAALIVSEYGKRDPAHPGTLTLDPDVTQAILLGTATDTACPVPAEFTYRRFSAAAGEVVSSATCAGPADDNGFYGEGIVNAQTAVSAF